MMKQMKTANMVRSNLKLELPADTLYISLVYIVAVCVR